MWKHTHSFFVVGEANWSESSVSSAFSQPYKIDRSSTYEWRLIIVIFFEFFFTFTFCFIFEIEYPANFFNDHVRLISRKPLMIKISFSSLRNSAASCNLIFYRSTRFYRKFNPEFMPKHENVLNRNGNNSQHVHCIRSRHQIKWCLENVLQSFIIRDYYSKTHGVCTLKDSLVDDNLSSFSWVLLDDVQITSHAYIHINIGCRAFRVSHLRLFIPAFLNY